MIPTSRCNSWWLGLLMRKWKLLSHFGSVVLCLDILFSSSFPIDSLTNGLGSDIDFFERCNTRTYVVLLLFSSFSCFYIRYIHKNVINNKKWIRNFKLQKLQISQLLLMIILTPILAL